MKAPVKKPRVRRSLSNAGNVTICCIVGVTVRRNRDSDALFGVHQPPTRCFFQVRVTSAPGQPLVSTAPVASSVVSGGTLAHHPGCPAPATGNPLFAHRALGTSAGLEVLGSLPAV